MGVVHDLIEARGKRAVLETADLDRRAVEAALRFMGDEDTDNAFVYSGWAQSALPHRRIADGQVWQHRTDHMTLLVEPGSRVAAVGDPVPLGVPFGSRARLILIYLQTESLRTGGREVELGGSLRAWMGRMGISAGGKSSREVRDQAERIARCRISFHVSRGGRTGLVQQNIVDSAMFVDDAADPQQPSLFAEVARLSEGFFEQLRRHPVPVQEAAIRAISNNSMALDVYCWLAYRLHSLNAPKPVSWTALKAQFGTAFTRLDNFRTHFKDALGLALAVYPEAEVDVEVRGVTLKPSRPPVAPRLLAAPKRG